MSVLVQDVRFACRMLAKHPGFTIIVVLTLALGIGANTAIFSVISAVLMRPLPFESPEQLFAIESRVEYPDIDAFMNGASQPNFLDWQEHNAPCSAMAAYRAETFRLTGDDVPERLDGARVTSGFFSLLGVQPAVGRLFGPSDERADAAPTVVLSHELWQRRFGADPGIVGRQVTLNQESCTAIGVLSAGFSFPLEIPGADVFKVIRLNEEDLASRSARLLDAVGRLKRGISRQQAQTQMDAIAARLERQYPRANHNYTLTLKGLHERVVGDTHQTLLLLQGAVGLVLLVACTNCANLFLVRGSSRRQELAVRAALGAGRWRLIRQLLTESMLIGLISGALGVAMAYWCTDSLVAVLPTEIPLRQSIGIDHVVLGAALLASVLTGLLSGLPSAIRASRPSPHASLRADTQARGSYGRQRMQDFFVVSQTALALVLLIGAGLLTRSFARLMEVEPGFAPENVLTFRMDMSEAQHAAQRTNMLYELMERLSGLPGVESVAASLALPLGEGTTAGLLRVEDDPDAPTGIVLMSPISEEYFVTMEIPLLRGRGFTMHDDERNRGVAVVDERLARTVWPDGDPIGKRITMGYRAAESSPEFYEIVGIAANVQGIGLDSDGLPQVYVPYRQHPDHEMFVSVRTAGRPETLAPVIRTEAASILRQDAPYSFATMDDRLARSVKGRRCPMILFGVFASLALILAIVGVYGVLSYVVAQRTHDIGVRIALGARRASILVMMLKRGAILTGTGLILGNAISLGATRVLSTQLFGISSTDLTTFVTVSILLAAAAAWACYIPARRATRVDPAIALRCD